MHVNYKIFISYDSKVMAKVKENNRQDRQINKSCQETTKFADSNQI